MGMHIFVFKKVILFVNENFDNMKKNFKIFFDGVFLSIYSHLLKKLELSKLSRKKVMGLLKS